MESFFPALLSPEDLPFSPTQYHTLSPRPQIGQLMPKVSQNLSWIWFLYLLALTPSSAVTLNHQQADDSDRCHPVSSTGLPFPSVSWTSLYHNTHISAATKQISPYKWTHVGGSREWKWHLTSFLAFELQWEHPGSAGEKAHLLSNMEDGLREVQG